MLSARVLRYKNETVTKFNLYSKQLLNNISKYHDTSSSDKLSVAKVTQSNKIGYTSECKQFYRNYKRD